MKQLVLVFAVLVALAYFAFSFQEKVKIEDIEIGNGPAAKSGDTVAVHYTGLLASGRKFDSSIDKGEPLIFTLGAGKVIPGWEQGLPGMRVGGKRQLTIPPKYGYGAQAVGDTIPANATLIFDVELLSIRK